MQYDASREALYSPEKDESVLDPGWFSGKPYALVAQLARLAYWRFEHDPGPLSHILAGHGLEWTKAFVDVAADTQAFACRDGAGTVYVSFRGTQSDNLVEPVNNLKAWRLDWDGPGKIHSGFGDAYCGKAGSAGVPVRGQIREWLAATGPARIVMTGHSLGGALATLCAIDHPGAELVTFGSPRVGNMEFAAAFAGRNARRYVDCCDVVTTVPPPGLYKHVGDVFYIDRDGKVLHPQPGFVDLQFDQAQARLQYVPLAVDSWSTVKLRDFADHAPINYVTALLGIREPI